MSVLARPTPITIGRSRHREVRGGSAWFMASRGLLFAVLFAAPMAFGAVQPWAWGLVTATVCASLLLWAAGSLQAGASRILWSPFYLPALVLTALSIFQMAAGLSLDRISTREATLKLVTCLSIFFVAQQLFSAASSRVWRRTALAVSAFSFLLSVFAIAQSFVSPGMVYGIFQSSSNAPFGPYINHTNYAGLMAMLIPISIALWLSLERGHQLRLFLSFAILVSLVSVLLSGARSSVIALAVELVLFGATLFFFLPGRRSTVASSAAVVGVALACFLCLDTGAVLSRWREVADKPDVALGQRLQISKDSLRLFRDHPIFGAGIGAFEIAYTPYQTVITEHAIDYAHNDYVQLLAEGGLIGLVAAGSALILFIRLLILRLPHFVSSQVGWIQLGAAVGVCGLLVNSLSDFNLHIPANAAWFCTIAALATLDRLPASTRP